MMKRFGKQLADFVDSKDTFKLVFQTRAPHSSIHILDSSFNPPHHGHLQLIKSSKNLSHVVLLLSINNADKLPKPAAFDERLDMIFEFGECLKTDNVDYSICLLKSPKFVDKSAQLDKQFQKKKYFLLGFDTLVRIFDQKYYIEPIEVALKEFMEGNEFICVTRSRDYEHQINYLKDLLSGNSLLPSIWAEKISLFPNGESSNEISSSQIRDRVKEGESIKGLTFDTIVDYIDNLDLYKD